MLPLILILAHAALLGIALLLIRTSRDPETELVLTAFYFIDYPAGKLIFDWPQMTTRASTSRIIFQILALGTLQWGLIGLAIQLLVSLLTS